MPNGYDRIYAGIRVTYEFLNYCDALLAPQKAMIDSVKDFSLIHESIRPSMTNLLHETEFIANATETMYLEKVRPGMVEHNEEMPKAMRFTYEMKAKAGYMKSSEINGAVEDFKKRMNLDYQAIDARFTNTKKIISALRQKIEEAAKP